MSGLSKALIVSHLLKSPKRGLPKSPADSPITNPGRSESFRPLRFTPKFVVGGHPDPSDYYPDERSRLAGARKLSSQESLPRLQQPDRSI